MKTFFILTVLSLQVFGIRVSQKKCDGYNFTVPPISEAEDAILKEFPFMGRVLNTNGGYANGILISDEFVLSTDVDSSSTITDVVLGDLLLKTNEDNAQSRFFEVIEEIPYPGFNDMDDKIRLLKLNESIKFNDYIRPACISQPKCKFSQQLLAIGWSDTNVRSNEKLHKVNINYIANTKCQEAFLIDYKTYIQGIENKTHFCAAAAEERDMCEGFAGAALTTRTSLNEISGIVMFKRDCGHEHPYIYVGISALIDWIESNVWPSEYKKYMRTAYEHKENCTESEDTIETDVITIKVENNMKEPEPTMITHTETLIEADDGSLGFDTKLIISLIIVVSMESIALLLAVILMLMYRSRYRQLEPVCKTNLKEI